jgi:cytoskeletal protein CcmA (bactofilin family)
LVGDFFGEGKIVVGPNGSIRGNVVCKSADIEGYYEGKIQVTELLSIKGTATILGEVIVGQLSVEPGAKFSASCVMKGLESKALLSHEAETA